MRPTAILVVDDDADHAHIASLVLGALVPGTPTAACHDLPSALIALDEVPGGTLVLMDRLLHGTESYDTMVRMRARRPDLRIVMLSAALSSVDRAYAIACGAVEAIEKPSTLAGWRSVLGALVASDDAPERRSSRAA